MHHSVTFAFSAGNGLSSVSLHWPIGALLVGEMPLPRGAEAAASEFPLPSAARSLGRGKLLHVLTLVILLHCLFGCIFMIAVLTASDYLSVHFGGRISLGFMLNFVATSIRAGLTGLDIPQLPQKIREEFL